MAYTQAKRTTYPTVTSSQLIASLPPLSLEQSAIVDYLQAGRGDLVINAVAGSGKTTSLKHIIARLKSDRAIYCVFSKEMEREVKPQLAGLCEVKTTYAVGYACIAYCLGKSLDVQENKYAKLAEVQANVLASQMRLHDQTEETKVNEREIKAAIVKLIELCQMNLSDPADLDELTRLADHYGVDCPVSFAELSPIIKQIMRAGIQQVEDYGIISYGDMIWIPHVLGLRPRQFLYVLVDEAQDTNKAQQELLFKMRAPGGRMVWVGDRNQAIFGFAGADANSFNSIKTKSGAAELPLNTCYRCPVSVLTLAQMYVPDIKPAPDAPFGLVSDIKEFELPMAVRDGDMVLCRKTAPLIKHCLAMIAKKVPARLKGKDIGKTLAAFIETVAAQVGFSYERFPDFVERYMTKMVKRLERRGEDAEPQIDALRDKASAIMVCYENFTDCESTQELKDEIAELFTDGRPGVILATGHRAKGLEAARVFVVEPENLPLVRKGQKAWEAQQERNLAYVVYTRVKYNNKTGAQGELIFVSTAPEA